MTDDPFAALEEAAQRHILEEAAGMAVSQARARLILGKDAPSAFFATLALRLEAIADWSIPTASVDGKKLRYNPEWFAALTPHQAKGVIAHEVLHCSNKHFTRRGQRDPALWNVACDLAINPLLAEAGLELPKARLMPGEVPYHEIPPGRSAEAIYDLLRKDASPQQEADPGADGAGDPGGCGGVQDAAKGSPAEARQAEAEWDVAVAQAQQVAKQRGALPGGLQRLVQQVLQPKVDWRDVLREFVSRYARNDYACDGPLQLHPQGGGGTDHRPVFAWVEKQGLTPTCMVCLTDLCTEFPLDAPAYPVLWAVAGGDPRSNAPFGIQVSLD